MPLANRSLPPPSAPMSHAPPTSAIVNMPPALPNPHHHHQSQQQHLPHPHHLPHHQQQQQQHHSRQKHMPAWSPQSFNNHPKTSSPSIPQQQSLPLDSFLQDAFSDPINPPLPPRDNLSFSLAAAAADVGAAVPQPTVSLSDTDAFAEPLYPPRRRPVTAPPTPGTNATTPQLSPVPVNLPEPRQRSSAPSSRGGLLPVSDPDSLSPSERRRVRMEIRRQRLRGRAGPATAGPVSRARVEKVSTPASAASADARMKALDKKAARVIRNREVALRARQAAKTKMKNLESENCNLKSRATTLEIENSTLKSQIEMLRRNAGPNVSPWNDPTFEGVVGAITQ